MPAGTSGRYAGYAQEYLYIAEDRENRKERWAYALVSLTEQEAHAVRGPYPGVGLIDLHEHAAALDHVAHPAGLGHDVGSVDDALSGAGDLGP